MPSQDGYYRDRQLHDVASTRGYLRNEGDLGRVQEVPPANIAVAATQIARLDVALEVGAANESVTVKL